MVPELEAIEKLAMRGEEMPTGLGYPEQVLFQALSHLYARYHLGKVEREQASLEKKKLLDEYRLYQFREQMGEEWVEVIRVTELARAEYRKNRTLENADKLLASIEGRGICRELS